MNRDDVARIWIDRGLCDLYFAFACADDLFEYNKRFSEIMGLEKFLKALLLYHRHKEYEGLTEKNARNALNKIARGYRHRFDTMLETISQYEGFDTVRILDTKFDGCPGVKLIDAVNAGYMETRYPVPKPISDSFPLGGGLTQDPLGSSGITKFIYAVCNECFHALALHVDFSDVRQQFCERFKHLESLPRFNNLVWESR